MRRRVYWGSVEVIIVLCGVGVVWEVAVIGEGGESGQSRYSIYNVEMVRRRSSGALLF